MLSIESEPCALASKKSSPRKTQHSKICDRDLRCQFKQQLSRLTQDKAEIESIESLNQKESIFVYPAMSEPVFSARGPSNPRDLHINTADISIIEGPNALPSGRTSTRSNYDLELINALSTDHELYSVPNVQVIDTNHAINWSTNAKLDINASANSIPSTVTLNKGMIKGNKSIELSTIDSQTGIEEITKPKVVLVSFKINYVTEIDVVQCTFNISCSLFYHWEDPALIGHPVGACRKSALGPDSDADIIVVNDMTLEETSSSEFIEVLNSSTGAVKLSKHVKGKVFMMSLDLQMFPFDVQNLSINLRPKRQDVTKCVLEYFSEQSTVNAQPQHEWVQHGYSALTYTTLPQFSTTGKIYSSLHIVVLVQRLSGWFVQNVFLMSFILTLISWISYVPIPLSQSRFGAYDIIVLTLLVSVANRFYTGSRIPKLSYRTVADTYIDISFLSQIFAIISVALREGIVNENLTDSMQSTEMWGAVPPRLNALLFGINAGLFGLYHLWLFYKLYHHGLDVNTWKSKALSLNNVYERYGNVPSDKDNQGLVDTVHSNLDDINKNNFGAYKNLGFFGAETSTKNRKEREIETFGQQTVLEEEDEEALISVLSAKHNPADANQSEIERKVYKHSYTPSYINKLNAFQRALALRADLGCRLAKYGLTADYCRPEIDDFMFHLSPSMSASPKASTGGKPASFNKANSAHSSDKGMINGESSLEGSTARPANWAVASDKKRKNSTLDFQAEGHVMTKEV